jgi:6-pyruvoyltetrahydropterin/6-carboxytetrahydropterin synthase
MKQYIIRKGTFDSGHRVMNEKMKCFNLHGHTYLYEVSFEFEAVESIGYAIDFKEVKRVACQWIDDMLDHGMILNPLDVEVLKSVQATGSKLWTMSLNGRLEYCNPSVENIAKEIFLAMEVLFVQYPELKMHELILHETPNCYTRCLGVSDVERDNWRKIRFDEVDAYAKEKGIVEYDDRK